MKKTILAISLALLISGCSIFGDKIAEEVARGIDDYCKEPQQARELYRAQVNAELAQDGHSITVVCAGDTTQ